ncbi:MAG TPA: zf-HC2 domain-containing protein [Candidatus Acidoferrales bacterium]|nr:zf-HC2 domain-containing protein [Candidatus Acidoferrales bacterium]
MNEHEEMRELLSLAAAGALGTAEEERVARHIRSCTACAAEFDEWRLLAGGMHRLPTPQPPPGLVERSRIRAEARLAEEAERRWHRGVMVFLIVFAWVVTLASWPVFRLVSGGLLYMFNSNWNQAWLRFASFATFAWLVGGVAAVVLSIHQRRERRMT